MVASSAVLFSSCGKKSVDFSNEYTVVYSKGFSSTVGNEFKSFVALLKSKTGSEFGSKRVDPESELTDEVDYEILVGNTNRPETAKVLKKIKGHGYAISVVGKKIVIVGTTNLLTAKAMELFADTYLSGDSASSFRIESNVVSDIEMVEITTKWGFVYSGYLNEADMIVKQVKEIKAGIGNYSDVRGNGMFMRSENESASAETEILVGMVDREEVKAFASGMDVTNYGVGVKNGKLVAFAYNDTMMTKALDVLSDLLKDSALM